MRIVTSLAVDDLGSTVPTNLLPNSSPDDASGNFMSDFDAMTYFSDTNDSPLLAPNAESPPKDVLNSAPPLAADVKPSPDDVLQIDLLASGAVEQTTDGSLGNKQIPGDASAECNTDTLDARSRVRRGCITYPNTQASSDTEKKDAQVDDTQNSKEQNGIGQDSGEEDKGEQQDNHNDAWVSPELFVPSLDFRIPEVNEVMCNPIFYGDSNIPMCDSGNRRRDVLEYYIGVIKYGLLFQAIPCTFIL